MAWSCGIVGLPNAGKSTLFKALTAIDVTIENYPFSTVDPNKAIVPIPDQRLQSLAAFSGSAKITPATIEIIDVAGLVKGASRGEGLGNQFLGHLRNVDLLIHVVAGYGPEGFDQDGTASRIETVNIELALADIEVIARRRQKVEPKLKSGDKKASLELELLTRLENDLSRGLFLHGMSFQHEEQVLLDQLSLLTNKEMVYVFNQAEGVSCEPDLAFFPRDSLVISMSAKLEAEIADLPIDERNLFLQAYNLETSRSDRLLKECYTLLKLLSFYTIKGSEARSWVAPAGIRAIEAAGMVHTDMEKGFINAEVIAWDSLLAEGSLTCAREKGLCRVEGKDYPVKDGDVLFFRFRA